MKEKPQLGVGDYLGMTGALVRGSTLNLSLWPPRWTSSPLHSLLADISSLRVCSGHFDVHGSHGLVTRRQLSERLQTTCLVFDHEKRLPAA